jgi:hypothetical protein
MKVIVAVIAALMAAAPKPLDTNAPNLAQELAQKHRTFAGYSEDLPRRRVRALAGPGTTRVSTCHGPILTTWR